VSCVSCHTDVVQAAGGTQFEAFFENDVLKTAIVLKSGEVKQENCRSCHDQVKFLNAEIDPKIMHEKHVTVKNARCFECHQPIRHANSNLKTAASDKPPMVDLSRSIQNSCVACHTEPHRYQQLLAKGMKRKGVLAAPDPMYKARTQCMGCHVELKPDAKGQMVLKASEKTCVMCHTKDHDKMFKDWKTELANEVKDTQEIEKEAVAVLEDETPKLAQAVITEAQTLLAEGRENLNIVVYGNGVHNKKYSIMLIDAAITAFEDMIDLVEENAQQ